MEKCYRVHGYPPDFKFTNFKGKKVVANAEITTSGPEVAQSPSGVPNDLASMLAGLSKEQCDQVMHMMQSAHLSLDSHSSLLASAHFAGIVPPIDSCIGKISYGACMITKVDKCIWIIDSGATDHMTSNLELLFDIQPLVIPYLVSLPNGYKVKVTSTGSIKFLSLTLHHVLFIPNFQYNLISVSKLICQLDCFVLFTKISCIIQASSLEIGKLQNGLYKLLQASAPSSGDTSSSSLHVASQCNSSFPVPSSLINPECNASSAMNKTEILWHNRLGHVPFVRMKDITQLPCRFSSKQSYICSICPLARQSRLPFPDSSIKTTNPFQLIYVDTWGPYSTLIYAGHKYFLTIVDDFTKATWSHFMGSKSNAFPLIQPFIAMVNTQFHASIQTIRTDNALELGSSNSASQFFLDHGYKLYNLVTKLILISRDVIFHESNFPFASLPSTFHPHSAPFPPYSYHDSPVLPSVPLPADPNITSSTSVNPPPLRRSSKSHTLPSHLTKFHCDLPSSLCGSSSSSICTSHLDAPAVLEPHFYKQAALIPAGAMRLSLRLYSPITLGP
ncbi:uncharacterized protein LOC132057932 [Lycium ferocissimum]|uniref:uncharacterized protein LOC132057932 n=1 Tax=Lycium ferocissimum TaxID=112874 RepID=UPI002815F15F|nr:uncharacterized protein LOC132057932 [Lycium ferocissimum]